MTDTHAEPGTDLAAAPPRPVLASCDVPRDLDQQIRLASAIAAAGVLPTHLRKQPGNVLAICFAARALDLPLWQAMQEMHNVDGKIGISANLMRALWLRAGHGFRIVERTPERATVEVTRTGTDPYRLTFTMDDARQAGLAGKGNWAKYPTAMLVARATSAALREVGADVLLGFGYTPEELRNGEHIEHEVTVDVTVVQDAQARVAEDDARAADLRARADAAPTLDVCRDLWREANAAGLLDRVSDAITARKTVLEAEPVDAVLVPDDAAVERVEASETAAADAAAEWDAEQAAAEAAAEAHSGGAW